MKVVVNIHRAVLLLLLIQGTAMAQTQFDWPADGESVIGEVQTVRVADGETLLDIAERHGLGYADIRDANLHLDPWLPEVGASVTLPTQYVLPDVTWEGIVINLAEYRLYYFLPDENTIHTFPVGIGRGNTPTPQGDMNITARIPNPTWYPPESIRQRWEEQGREIRRVVPAGPDNPLGPYAINLSAQGYLIHGTNQRFGIGAQTSAGCIRMNNHDIEALVYMTAIGVPVRIIDKPLKIGVTQGKMVMEVHREVNQGTAPASSTDLVYTLTQTRDTNSERAGQIDWDMVELAFTRKTGIPLTISYQ
ncbi:L,D-transpeptidase family protein [Aliidiomarina soli]|uniref:L,D-TPase catalytic domain-containing protein n=1 Tax=Aliidiomarina soli TaxID=1928574 RepID=A0A432WIL3_9GAMM|nr:L,D-transpeptidase family protein [Aliidiomarina soli]RUO33613.1 hypothetical protein CWE14_03880 [Aliidiomarina soli]